MKSAHWIITAAALVMLAVLLKYGTSLEHALTPQLGATALLRVWLGLVSASHLAVACGRQPWIRTTWASYLLSAFLLRQLLSVADGATPLGLGMGFLALGISDISWSPRQPGRRSWLGQVVVVMVLLLALVWLRATEVDQSAVSTGWPAPTWNDPTLHAWFVAQPRVPQVDNACSVLVFLDYQCPLCAVVHREYGERLHMSRRVCIVDFPLEPECNPNVPQPTHALACELAVLVNLTRKIDSALAERRASEIFGGSVSRRYVWSRLREVGVHGPDDRRYQEALRTIRENVTLGKRYGVEATPTFVVNGTRVAGALAPRVYDRILQFSTEDRC